MYARLKHIVSIGYHASIFRRTIILAVFILPAFAANFFVYFFGARLLSADQFGLFYVALTIGNVLYSGALILNIFFTRYFVRVIQSTGEQSVFRAMLRVEKVVILAGGALSAVVLSALLLAGSYVGVQSRVVILLIVLDAFTAYVGDLARVLLQSLRRTIALGCYTLIWMLLKLVLCIGGLWAFNSVWAGLLGAVVSAVIMFTGFQIWVSLSARSAPGKFPPMPPAWTLVVPALGYGLMIVVSNMDVLTSYFLLADRDLGVYSASSVLPKSILVVITPLLQMLFPMMVPGHVRSEDSMVVIGKIVGTMLALTLAAMFMIWLLSGWVCGGPWGIALCDDRLLGVLLLSAAPLALLRVLVMLQFARGREALTLWLIVPLAVYGYVAWFSAHTMDAVAQAFATASGLTLLFFLGIKLAVGRLPARASL
jgi:O-antigen/teichoic acid export membrane protein